MFRFLRYIVRYCARNLVWSVAGAYFVLSITLKALTGIDYCLPCLHRLIFGVRCPGCGLSTAFVHLLQLDITEAVHDNILILIVLPAGAYYICRDIVRFTRMEISAGR